jgi:hypothetical protein
METAGVVVCDGMGLVGFGEVDTSFRGRVGANGEVGAGGKIVVLVQAERLAVVRRVATAMER